MCLLFSSLSRPEDSRWIHQADGSYHIDWEAPEVSEKIQSNIDFLLKGCSCKKGCVTRNCGCRRKKTTVVANVSARDARIYLSKFRKRNMITAMTTKVKLTT